MSWESKHICWTTSVRSYPMICGRMSIRCVYSFLRIRCFRHKCCVYIRIAQVLHTIVFTCAAHSISAVGPSSNLAQRADSRMSCACIICRLESHHSKTFSTARCWLKCWVDSHWSPPGWLSWGSLGTCTTAQWECGRVSVHVLIPRQYLMRPNCQVWIILGKMS